MTGQPVHAPDAVRLERTYEAPPGLVWELCTTPAGIEEWWTTAGFVTQVTSLDLEPGGALLYTMTATAPEQIAFLRDAGVPLTSRLRKTYTEVVAPTRLAFLSLIDFVPDHGPYDHLTTFDIVPAGGGTTLIMTLDPLHDETWTQQHRAHRRYELDTLEAALQRRVG